MSGHPSGHAQAFAAARLGGRINMLGTPSRTTEVDFARDLIFKGLTLYGVTGRRMYRTWDEMQRFLRAGELDPRPVITHRFPLERIADAIQVIKDGSAGKVILEVSDEVTTDSTRDGSKRLTQLAEFKRDGVYKRLNHLDGPQGPRAKMEGRGEVIILSSNNYLGLCNEPEVVQAGKDGLDHYGAGTASVRFICGTFTIHRELEAVAGAPGGHAGVAELRELLERQRGGARHAAGRGGPGAQRPAQPRLDHRRRPAVEGDRQVPDRGLPAREHGRPRRQAGGGEGPAHQDGDHRRRVLHGRRDRAAARPGRDLPEARRGAGGG